MKHLSHNLTATRPNFPSSRFIFIRSRLMHNAANNTEKYEGKSPLWESALLLGAQGILFPRPQSRSAAPPR